MFSLQAATINWDGGAGNGNWTSANNWSNNSAWTSTNTANFDTDLAGGQYNISLGLAQTARNITFSSGAATQGFTFSGSALTISNAAGIVNNDADTQTFGNAVTLGTSLTFSAASGGLTFNGNITNGANTLTLSAASGKSGTIAGVIGSGSGGVTKTGAGTWTLSGANTYTGATTINAGTLSIGSIANGGTASGLGKSTNAANRLVLGGGTLQYTGSTASTNRAFTLTTGTNSSFDITSAGTNLTISGASAATTGGLIKIGAGTLTLSGTNQHTGVTTINAGTLSVATIGNGGVAGNLGKASNAANRIVLGGGTLQYTGSTASTNRAFTLTNGTNSSFDIASAGTNLTISGASAATTGGLTKIGAGTLTLSGTNQYTGATTVNAGTLSVATIGNGGVAGNLGQASNAANRLVLGGGTLQFTGSTASTNRAFTLTNGTTSGFDVSNSGTNLTISGSSAATTGGLTKIGAGTLTLSGTNQYTGATTVNAGTLSVGTIGNGGVSGNLGQASNAAANLVLGGGTLQYTGSTASTNRNFTLTAGTSSLIDVSNGATTLTMSGASTATSGSLTKTGAGTLALSGTSQYTGTTTVSQGTLQLNANAPSGAGGTLGNAASAVTVNDGNTGSTDTALLVGASGVTVARAVTVANAGTGTTTLGGNIASGTGTFTGAVTLNKAANLNADGTSAIEFKTGAITGTGAITKTGTGTVLINTANSSSGTTTVNAGTLAVDGNQVNNRLANSANVVVNSGGTFEVRGVNAISNSSPANFTLNSGGTLSLVSGASTNGGTTSHVHLGNLTLAGGTIDMRFSGSGSAYNNESAQLDGSVTVTADSNIQFGTGATATNAGLALNGINTFTVNPGVTLNVSAELENRDSGNNGFTKAGTGTMVLSGTNTYTGATTVNAGTLSVGTIGNGGVAGNLGQASNAAANLVLGGGTLQYTGSTASTDRNFTLTAGTTSTVDVVTGGTNLTVTGSSASTTGALTKAGLGTLTLSGTNLHSGTTTVSAGTLFANGSSSLGASSGNVTVNSGGTLSLAGGAAVTGASPTNAQTITKSGTLTLAGTGASGALGALQAGGSTGQTSQWIGNITLSGDATVGVDDKLLLLGNGMTHTDSLNLNGHMLTLNTTSASTYAQEYVAAPSFLMDNTDLVLYYTLSGGANSGLIKDGAGTATLFSFTDNTFSGPTLINDGKLAIGGATNKAILSSTSITVGDGVGSAGSAILQMGFLASQPTKNNIIGHSNAGLGTADASITVNADGFFNMNAGSNGLVDLTLNSGHVGDTYLATGQSSLLSLKGVINSTGTGSQTAVIDNWKVGMASNSFAINVTDGTAATDLRIDSILVNDVGFTNANTATSLAKTGAGALRLTGTNTYQGVTDIQAGTLVITNNSALGQSGSYSGDVANGTSVQAGAQLQLDGTAGNLTIGNETLSLNGNGTSTTGELRNVAGSNQYNGFVNLTGDSRINADTGTALTIGATAGSSATLINGSAAGRTLTIGGDGNTTVNAVIGSNIGTLVKDGTGTLTLAGQYAANTNTSIKDGTVALNMTNGLTASGATVTIGDGVGAAGSAKLLLQQSNQIADTAAVSLGSDGILDLNSKNDTIGSIAGAGQILLGTGQLIAGGNGNSTAFAGTLVGQSSSVFTKTGAGTLTINSNLNASPGDFAGTLNLAAGELAFNVSNAFTGTVNISAGATLKLSDANLSIANLNFTGHGTITLDFSGVSSTLSATNLSLQYSDTLISIINWQNAADFFYAANWTGAVVDLVGQAPMNQVNFNTPWTGNDTKWQSYDQQITPVPEPSTYGAMLLAVSGVLLGWRRFRRGVSRRS